MSAHDAAVEAMARALSTVWPIEDEIDAAWDALAALVRSEAVRAALYGPCVSAVVDWTGDPDDADAAPSIVDAILAALRPDDEGGAG